MSRVAFALESALGTAALAAMVTLPLLEILLRATLGVGVSGSGPIVQHLVLWVAFIGAALAARDGKLLAMSTSTFIPEGRSRAVVDAVSSAVAALVTTVLAAGAVQLVLLERTSQTTIGGGIPTWIAQLAMPVGLAVIAARLAWRAGPSWMARAVAALAIVVGLALVAMPASIEGKPAWPWMAALVGAGLCGAPIFAVLGGAAAFLFMTDAVTPATVLVETYALTTSPTLPAIPLFTLAGFVMAEGRSAERLLRVFRAWFGWIPGGTAVVCALLCSFFTVFTGGSGVTILALGGLLLPALVNDGYRERFAIGLLTASGSLGLLLPPALPMILFAVVAQLPVEDLFVGGLVPGLLLTGLVAARGVREGLVSGAGRAPFRAGEALSALWEAKWELALPLIVLVALFSGRSTVIEAAALTACYALLVQTGIHRDLTSRRDLVRVFTECLTVIGGVLLILGVAVGLTSYLVGGQVPTRLLEWTSNHIESRAAFLLALNLFLLAVGCVMDIFSAIVVVAPLIVPLGAAFDVHPVHLGVIFIANLELGYLTPPVGLNLFLASYRFKRPLLEIVRAALPMMVILGAGVLLITYVPWLTLGLLGWLGRS